jgi:hypothetical protein
MDSNKRALASSGNKPSNRPRKQRIEHGFINIITFLFLYKIQEKKQRVKVKYEVIIFIRFIVGWQSKLNFKYREVIKLIKMRLNKTFRKLRGDKLPADAFPIRNYPTGESLSPFTVKPWNMKINRELLGMNHIN